MDSQKDSDLQKRKYFPSFVCPEFIR